MLGCSRDLPRLPIWRVGAEPTATADHSDRRPEPRAKGKCPAGVCPNVEELKHPMGMRSESEP